MRRWLVVLCSARVRTHAQAPTISTRRRCAARRRSFRRLRPIRAGPVLLRRPDRPQSAEMNFTDATQDLIAFMLRGRWRTSVSCPQWPCSASRIRQRQLWRLRRLQHAVGQRRRRNRSHYNRSSGFSASAPMDPIGRVVTTSSGLNLQRERRWIGFDADHRLWRGAPSRRLDRRQLPALCDAGRRGWPRQHHAQRAGLRG